MLLISVNGVPLSARATQLTLRPPVFGTTARPLTTKLCRASKFVGPSFRSRFRSSSTWKPLAATPLPVVLPRDFDSVYETRVS